jgi:hypothetical protein
MEFELDLARCWFDLTGNRALVRDFLSELSKDGWQTRESIT